MSQSPKGRFAFVRPTFEPGSKPTEAQIDAVADALVAALLGQRQGGGVIAGPVSPSFLAWKASTQGSWAAETARATCGIRRATRAATKRTPSLRGA